MKYEFTSLLSFSLAKTVDRWPSAPSRREAAVKRPSRTAPGKVQDQFSKRTVVCRRLVTNTVNGKSPLKAVEALDIKTISISATHLKTVQTE